MATLTFVAARAAPPLALPLALAGGVALARAGERFGLRKGYGAGLGAVLETFSILGPARLGAPTAQIITAPAVGRLAGRGSTYAVQVAVCSVLRIIYNLSTTAFFIWIITGGLDPYQGTFEKTIGRIPGIPEGEMSALIFTVIGVFVFSTALSALQVHLFHRAAGSWRDDKSEISLPHHSGPIPGVDPAPGASADSGLSPDSTVESGRDSGLDPAARDTASSEDIEPPTPRFDPRAVTLVAFLLFVALLVTTAWSVLGAVTGFLVLTWVVSRPETDNLPAGLILAALLFTGALLFNWIGGEGIETGAERGSRAALLVLTATWMRGAAGAAGFREVTRRGLRRLRAIPTTREAGAVLDEMGVIRELRGAARSLVGAIRPAGTDPVDVADAVLDWVRHEAERFRPKTTPVPPELSYRLIDGALVVASLAPAAVFISSL